MGMENAFIPMGDVALELVKPFDTDGSPGHVRQRREVPRRTHRTLGRDARIYVVIDQRTQRVDQLRPHARESFAERNYFHEHDQAHGLIIEILADARRVADRLRRVS